MPTATKEAPRRRRNTDTSILPQTPELETLEAALSAANRDWNGLLATVREAAEAEPLPESEAQEFASDAVAIAGRRFDGLTAWAAYVLAEVREQKRGTRGMQRLEAILASPLATERDRVAARGEIDNRTARRASLERLEFGVRQALKSTGSRRARPHYVGRARLEVLAECRPTNPDGTRATS